MGRTARAPRHRATPGTSPMTTDDLAIPPQDDPIPEPGPVPERRAPSLLGRLWSMLQLVVAVAIAGGTLAILLLRPDAPPDDDGSRRRPPEPAEVAGAMLIR